MMSFKKTSLMMLQLFVVVCCFFVFLMTVSASSAMAASKIAFHCAGSNPDESPTQLCAFNPDGSGYTQITHLPLEPDCGCTLRTTQPMDWSPDGTQIAAIGNSAANEVIMMVFNVSDGSLAHEVVFNANFDPQQFKFAWSPELPASVASISPFGQFVIVFLLGGASALWMTKRTARLA